MTATFASTAAFWSEALQRVVIADSPTFYAGLRQMGFGDGETLVVLVEREAEAVLHGQYKYLYGHVLRPVAKETGHTASELLLMAKAQFMPDDGRTSLTQLTREEMDEFSRETERWLREECPRAFDVRLRA